MSEFLVEEPLVNYFMEIGNKKRSQILMRLFGWAHYLVV
jgi:hypothetical protein